MEICGGVEANSLEWLAWAEENERGVKGKKECFVERRKVGCGDVKGGEVSSGAKMGIGTVCGHCVDQMGWCSRKEKENMTSFPTGLGHHE